MKLADSCIFLVVLCELQFVDLVRLDALKLNKKLTKKGCNHQRRYNFDREPLRRSFVFCSTAVSIQ